MVNLQRYFRTLPRIIILVRKTYLAFIYCTDLLCPAKFLQRCRLMVCRHCNVEGCLHCAHAKPGQVGASVARRPEDTVFRALYQNRDRTLGLFTVEWLMSSLVCHGLLKSGTMTYFSGSPWHRSYSPFPLRRRETGALPSMPLGQTGANQGPIRQRAAGYLHPSHWSVGQWDAGLRTTTLLSCLVDIAFHPITLASSGAGL